VHRPVLALALLLSLPTCALAQGAGRIWGRVETRDGKVLEGFIRWDRNEGSWVDLLNGSKHVSLESVDFRVWNDGADSAEVPPDRVIDVQGFRISWPDALEGFPGWVASGVRFGHIRRLVPEGRDSVRLVLKSGQEVALTGGATDLGPEVRKIVVEAPGRREADLEWSDLAAIDFGPAPQGARPQGERIHGTVRDRRGDAYTGFIGWDRDKILTTDELVGQGARGERKIPFGRISSVEKTGQGVLVVTSDGDTVELTGSEDVTARNDGIDVSDPDLGAVELGWGDFESVRVRPPQPAGGDDAFDGGRPLRGTVVTLAGRELAGRIRFDADEASSWEVLDGIRDHVRFDIEFGDIARIVPLRLVTGGGGERAGADAGRGRIRGARVTLNDGRVVELEGSNDVDEGNKGVMILGDEAGPRPWILVRWQDVKELRLDHAGGGPS
jgi:hypothetical protein